jgi:uncharacterized protein (TIGR00661 family)
MRIAFVVQGEGRGHMTQALAMKAMLERNGHQIVGVLVGQSSVRSIPNFFLDKLGKVPTVFPSPNFITDASQKGIRVGYSIWKNLGLAGRFIKSLHIIEKQLIKWDAELVINFYEPLMGLYSFLGFKKIPMVAIAHQYVYLHKAFQFPKAGAMQRRALTTFTKITSAGALMKLAISLYPMVGKVEGIEIVPPLLRSQLFALQPRQGDYYLVYLLNTGYIDEILDFHRKYPKVKLHCFTDRKEVRDEMVIDDTLTFHQLSDEKFLRLMAGARGLVSTAGFESIAEAMYLGKPCLMVPVQGHWEQMSNALDAVKIGAGIHDTRFNIERLVGHMELTPKDYSGYRAWVDSSEERIMKALEPFLAAKSASSTATAGKGQTVLPRTQPA